MTNPAFKTYEVAVLFGQPVLFSYGRIDPKEVPENVHLYELRHDSYNISEPMWIEQKVDSDYYGTVITKEPIDLTGQYVSNTNTGEQVKMRTIDGDDFRVDDYAMATISRYLKGDYELTPEPEKSIRVLIVEPMEPPRVESIPNTLEAKQGIVGGLIQAIYPYPDNVAVVCNDEGKLIGLPLNRRIGHDIIAGNFIVCGVDNRNASFSSLTEAQVKRYQEKFSNIELFIGIKAKPSLKGVDR
jgi:hypothetical protein